MNLTDPRTEAALIASTPLPSWAAGYKLETRSDGRVWLHATVDGCEVFAQPKAWSTMILRDDRTSGDAAGAVNYGLQLGGMHAHAGQLETNDPTFGRELLGARTGSEVPMPETARGAASTGYALPALIVAVGMVAAALIARLKRRGS
jgi:hypothetical protein